MDQLKGEELKGIFFSKFDKDKGPIIDKQDPAGFVSKELFEVVAAHVIPKPSLAGKLIAITAKEINVVGCPVVIDNNKYDRNRFSFNICFVVHKDTNTEPYETCVRKVAQSFKLWEMETGELSNPTQDHRLSELLRDIRFELNRSGYCSIQLDQVHFLHLKLSEHFDDHSQPAVSEYDVPIFTRSEPTADSSTWVDLTVTQILPYINGTNAIVHISQEADVDVNLVKACVQNLVYYGDVKVISAFQYSNVYTTTGGIQRLYDEPELQTLCLQKVQRKGEAQPCLRDVMSLFCSMGPGTTIRELCVRHNPHLMKIDERRLVKFGMLHAIIRRLHRYPVKLVDTVGISANQELYQYCDGRHHTDDICCRLGMSFQYFNKRIEDDRSVVVCWK